jgi:hypothetical protein
MYTKRVVTSVILLYYSIIIYFFVFMNTLQRNTYMTTGVLSLVALAVTMPEIAFAQATFETIVGTVGDLLDLLIPIIVTLAVVIFFWGLALFLVKVDEEKEKGRSIMIYGVLVLFVMIAIWGLVELLANTFDIHTGGSVTPPSVNR